MGIVTGPAVGPKGTVRYDDSTVLWHGFEDLVLNVARRNGVTSVAELGGGANPFVGDAEKWQFAHRRVVIDISRSELDKAQSDVEKRVADLCLPVEDGLGSYDLVFSKFLCEHLPDPKVFHENCFRLLRPGGLSVHYFPTLGTLPFVLNKLIPETLSRSIVDKVQPGRLQQGNYDKFPAYYRWTTGPTRRAKERFTRVGFDIEEWHASFGHYYYRIVKPLHALEAVKTKFLLKHPVPALTSFAVLVLRKP